MATATLLTALLTLLHPTNALQRSDYFPYGHCYSTYGPTNSAASPECLTNDTFPSLLANTTLLAILLNSSIAAYSIVLNYRHVLFE